MSDNEIDPFHLLPDYYAISVIVADGPPQVNLGDCPPYVAVAILESVVDSLKECIFPPQIEYMEQEIYNPYMDFEDEDEE